MNKQIIKSFIHSVIFRKYMVRFMVNTVRQEYTLDGCQTISGHIFSNPGQASIANPPPGIGQKNWKETHVDTGRTCKKSNRECVQKKL